MEGIYMLEAIRFSDIKKTKKEMKVQNLPIEKIRPNPFQPRKYFDQLSLEELAASIKEYGIMQPVSVRLISGTTYELVAGERRLRAASMAGLLTIPCIIINVNDNDSALIALIENLQRKNLNFIEEAEGYQNLMNDYGLTQEELASKLNKSQSTIANKLRILKLGDTIKKLIVEHTLTERHARAILKIPDIEVQKEIIYKVIDEDLNVKKTEELVQVTLDKMVNSRTQKLDRREKRYLSDLRLFTNTIRQTLEIVKKTGMETEYETSEKGEYYEIKIRIKSNIRGIDDKLEEELLKTGCN